MGEAGEPRRTSRQPQRKRGILKMKRTGLDQLLSSLRAQRCVGQIWHKCDERHPVEALGTYNSNNKNI